MAHAPTRRTWTVLATVTLLSALLGTTGCQGADDQNARDQGAGEQNAGEQGDVGSGIANPEALEAVIAAERSFSAMSTETGMRDAFLSNFTDDVVTFAPEPTVGSADLAAGPEGPKLEWWPEIAEASLAGDMGYTSGPYRVPLADGGSAWGHYHSVWGRQPDGGWKVLLDIGGPHGPVEAPTDVERPESSWSTPTEEVGSETLLERDRAFAQAYQSDGDAAVRAFALPRARFYRFGQAPLRGVGEALHDRSEGAEVLSWEPTDGRVAASGDMGYTYGTGSASRAEFGGAPRPMSYARVWRRTPATGWQMVLEVVLPYPPAQPGS